MSDAPDLAETRRRLAKLSAERVQQNAAFARVRERIDALARTSATFTRDADRSPAHHAAANALILALALMRNTPAPEFLPAPRRFRTENLLQAAWRRVRTGGRP